MKYTSLNTTSLRKFLGTALAVFASVTSVLAVGPATLSTGDIVIIGISGDPDDEFSWVPLVDLSAGEIIYFTTSGSFSSSGSKVGLGELVSNNSTLIRYTTPAGGVSAGVRQTVNDEGSGGYSDENTSPYQVVTTTSIASNSDLSLLTSGDQILAFQSTDAESGTFTTTNFTPLFAATTHSLTWSSSTTTSGTNLYPGLTDAANAVAAGSGTGTGDEYDNARYEGITSGTAADLLAAVADVSNWTGTNTTPSAGYTRDGIASNFTITTCTDPGTTWDGTDATTSSTALCISAGNTATGADVECDDLQVDASNTLTISHTVTVHGDITNNGTITIEDGGYLYQNVSTNANSGSGTYNVKQTSPSYADDERYSYWSSPVSSEQLQDVFPSTNTSDFYVYNNWPWTSVSASSNMASGFGYTATGDIGASGASTRTFSSSTIHNGDITVAGLGTDLSDWVLLGNPYPSTLDLDELETDNSHLSNSFWFWNHNTGGPEPDSTQDYAMYVKGTGGTAASSGGSTPNQYADKCQGFMVQFTSAANVTYNNSQRSASASAAFFKNGRSANPERQQIWLGLVSEHKVSNQILVAFVPDASDDYDERDGKKLKAESRLAFYSLAGQEELAVQGMAYIAPGKSKFVALGVDAGVTGAFTIRIDNMANVPDHYTVSLHDAETGQVIDLEAGNYTFNLQQTGTYTDRFVLEVTHPIGQDNGSSGVSDPGFTTGVEELRAEPVLRYGQNDAALQIWLEETPAVLEQVQVLDVQGREVFQRNGIRDQRFEIPVQSWVPGVYFLQWQSTDHSPKTTKVFIR